jgi:hypothetical protein
MTADVQKGAEEGNDVAHAPQSACTRREERQRSLSARGRVLRSVLRPVRVDPHYTRRSQDLRGGALVPISRLGKLIARWEEPTLGSARTDAARLAARHSRRKLRAWRDEEKEGGRGLRPCEDQESRFGCPHVVVRHVAEVGRRRLASNKLGKRAPKRAVRVE